MMILGNIKDPKTCFNCELELEVKNCPCNLGTADASDFKNSKHPDCPLIIIPDNVTNGDMIKATFPNLQLYSDFTCWNVDLGGTHIFVDKEWWNAPYNKEN